MVTGAFVTTHGHPPELRPYDVPAPGVGQSRIRVTAAPVTPLDVLCAGGTSYFGPPVLPYVPGVQGVGVVEQGERAGARVWFNTDAGMRPGDGSLAEAAVVHDLEAVDVPDGVSDVDAAALGLSAVAAWMALTWRGRLEAGERVLVLGAGGAVGQVAVQAATALGAGAVVAASRRPRGRDRALERGATAAIDLSDADVDEVTARLRAAADGGVDVIVDPIGGATTTAALRVLAEHGRLVHLGSSGGMESTFSSATLRSGSHSILGYTNNSLTRQQRADALAEIFALAAQGRCQVEHRAYPLSEVATAWQQAAGTPDARVVVTPTDDQTR